MPLPILALVTPPAAEPVSLTEAKLHCKVDGSAEDTLFTAWIAAARMAVESYTNRALLTQTWRVTYDAFPCAGKWLELPKPPFGTLSKIQARAADGTYADATLGDFDVLAPAGPHAMPASIGPKPDKAWPVPEWTGAGSARFEFTAGYGAAGSEPAMLKAAILLLVADMYTNREAQIVGTIVEYNAAVKRLLDPFRVPYV